jgi:hypothetical protein
LQLSQSCSNQSANILSKLSIIWQDLFGGTLSNSNSNKTLTLSTSQYKEGNKNISVALVIGNNVISSLNKNVYFKLDKVSYILNFLVNSSCPK